MLMRFVVTLQPLRKGSIEVTQSESVQDPCHGFLHLLDAFFKMTSPEVLFHLGEPPKDKYGNV